MIGRRYEVFTVDTYPEIRGGLGFMNVRDESTGIGDTPLPIAPAPTDTAFLELRVSLLEQRLFETQLALHLLQSRTPAARWQRFLDTTREQILRVRAVFARLLARLRERVRWR